jgi:hypothetical protein
VRSRAGPPRSAALAGAAMAIASKMPTPHNKDHVIFAPMACQWAAPVAVHGILRSAPSSRSILNRCWVGEYGCHLEESSGSRGKIREELSR